MNAKLSLTTTFNKKIKGGASDLSREQFREMARYLARRAARADYQALLNARDEHVDRHDTGQPESEPEP